MTAISFTFTKPFGDARVEELRLLAWADQQGQLQWNAPPQGPWLDLLLSLVSDDLLTTFSYEDGKRYFSSLGQGSSPTMASQSGIAGESRLERSIVIARVAALDALNQGGGVISHLTHAGRVRLSELKQALRSGRVREPFGILWDVRHWERDLQIALVDAAPSAPVSVAYLDLNGLKNLNDRYGHDAGDRGLRAYLQSVASVLGDTGQAYRLGGDEVLVILPAFEAVAAVRTIEGACRHLMNERLEIPGTDAFLSISAGLVCVVEPSATPIAVREAADKVQYRAKEESRKHSPRASVIALEGADEMKTIIK